MWVPTKPLEVAPQITKAPASSRKVRLRNPSPRAEKVRANGLPAGGGTGRGVPVSP